MPGGNLRRARNTRWCLREVEMIFLLSLTGDVTFDIPLRKPVRPLQPRPQGLLLVQNGGSENCQSGSKNSLKFRRKHDEMSSLRLNNGFRLQKTNRVARRWKQPPKKTLTVHHVSRDKILHDSWSISAALARGFSDPPFLTRRRPWGRG